MYKKRNGHRQYVNDELKDMFFKLDLIQSYGSGIRRAKNAMAANGSPKLVFTPNNDLDDYTLAEAYINEEFARIQKEENHKKETHELQSANERSLKEVLKEVLKEADYRKVENIIEVIDSQGSISPAEAKAVCGKSDSTTWRYLNILTATGLVISEGSTNHVRYRRNTD